MTFHSLQATATLAKPVEERRAESEASWAFKKAEEVFSFASCDNLDKLFKQIFAGCPAAEKFSMKHSKVSCVVRHGLGQVVQNELVKDINTSGNLYIYLYIFTYYGN